MSMYKVTPSSHAIMAEGGGEGDETNPFSFKTYVKKKTRQHEEQDIDTNDIFAITGSATSTRKKEKQSLVVAEDEDEPAQAAKTKKKGNKENPFSFKKFLGQSGTSSQKESPSSQRRTTPTTTSPQDVVRMNGPGFSSSSSSGIPARPSFSPGASPSHSPSPSLHQPPGGGTVAPPPDFASHLPDFIQNHFTEESPSQLEHDRRQLPDFALPSHGSSSSTITARDLNTAGSVFPSGRENGVVVDGGGGAFSDEEGDGFQRSRQLSLPDFLVDSAVPGAQGGVGVEESVPPSSVRAGQGSSSTRSQLPELPRLGENGIGGVGGAQNIVNAIPDDSASRQLQEENRQLKATLAHMRQKARDEEARVAGLEKEISRLRKKEAEETAVMESAVQQVEENLVATTTRAVHAEGQVSKLKQDVRSLQSQVKALTAENAALQSGDRGWADIRQRTTYASQQLASAAVTAESNLKELLNGVEKLKLLGQVLSSLEKVTDMEDSSPTQEDKTSPKSSSV